MIFVIGFGLYHWITWHSKKMWRVPKVTISGWNLFIFCFRALEQEDTLSHRLRCCVQTKENSQTNYFTTNFFPAQVRQWYFSQMPKSLQYKNWNRGPLNYLRSQVNFIDYIQENGSLTRIWRPRVRRTRSRSSSTARRFTPRGTSPTSWRAATTSRSTTGASLARRSAELAPSSGSSHTDASVRRFSS